MNRYIKENLNNYISSSFTEYAVLISGKWGSGKTFFINDYIKKYPSEDTNKDKKTIFLKISLFGLSSVNEVNKSIIFSLLNKNDNKLINSALKIGTNILDSLGGKFKLNIKDIPMEQIMRSTDGEVVFVFDDLERTNILLSELLGYINNLVEQLHNKVILLANEEKFSSEEESEKYKDFKEKVIGKTYETIQDFDSVYIQFISDVKHSKEILNEYSSMIKTIYKLSTYDNLRHIRQAIIDFDYFYSLINFEYKENKQFVKSLIQIYFMLFIEIRKGKLEIEMFRKVSNHKINLFSTGNANKENKKNDSIKYEDILKKYNFPSFAELYLSKELWISILFKNQIDKERINKELSNVSIFNNKDDEPWYILYDYWKLDDESFKLALAKFEKDFKDNKFVDHKKILMDSSILLMLSDKNLCNFTKIDIIRITELNIEIQSKTELWSTSKYVDDPFSRGYKYNGVNYQYAHDSELFKKIILFMKNEAEKAFENGLKYKAKKLLESLVTVSYEETYTILNKDFRHIPIFSHMIKEELVDALCEMQHKNLPDFSESLKDRYEIAELLCYSKSLTEDVKVWEYVYKNLLKNINKNKNPLKYSLLTNFNESRVRIAIDDIKESINRLQGKDSE